MKAIYSIVALIFFTGIFSSCKKDKMNTDMMGKSICASEHFTFSEDFKVNGETNPAAISFINAPYYVSLTAGLSEEIPWTITITGQTSGAVKTYSGFSNVVNLKWWGNADGNVFFQDNETCNVSFQPSCRTAVDISLAVTQKSTFEHFGVLCYDLDHVYGGAQGGQLTGNIDVLLPQPSPQGGYCHMMNWPAGNTTWYVGQYVKANLGTAMSTFAAGLSSDEVYVNYFLKGDQETIVSLVLWETVNGTDVPFKKAMRINWNGWKCITYKMSDLNIGDPSHVTEVDLAPSPMAYNGKMECYVDFMIITKGKPFAGAN